MSVDILGTKRDQCLSMVQCCFTSTETIRLIRTGSPGRPPRLPHSSRTLTPHYSFGTGFCTVMLCSLTSPLFSLPADLPSGLVCNVRTYAVIVCEQLGAGLASGQSQLPRAAPLIRRTTAGWLSVALRPQKS